VAAGADPGQAAWHRRHWVGPDDGMNHQFNVGRHHLQSPLDLVLAAKRSSSDD
jgi:hypothetical protein